MLQQNGPYATPTQGTGVYYENSYIDGWNLTVGQPVVGTILSQIANYANFFSRNLHGVYTTGIQNTSIRGNNFSGNAKNGVFGKGLSIHKIGRAHL